MKQYTEQNTQGGESRLIRDTQAPIQHKQTACLFPYEGFAMFRIAKGYDTVSKTIRIPEPTAQLLDKLACENNISLNQLINQCIEFALDHLYKDEDSQQR